jgi:methionyl-tRNA formyltransferase
MRQTMRRTTTGQAGKHLSGLRTAFMGMRGDFSRLPLETLLAGGADIRAVLVPVEGGDRSEGSAAVRRLEPQRPARSALPLLTPYVEPSVISLAWEHDILVLEVARERGAETIRALSALDLDVVCVACWPKRLPEPFLAAPRLGCLNLHPSLLPLHRGPAPLFWTLRHGDERAGVTVHVMDRSLDGGDILARAEVELPDGISGEQLERRCAEVGGQLLIETLGALGAGSATREPQHAGKGSYEPWPQEPDFVVTPDRPARWAFNFIRGATHWGRPPVVCVAGQRFPIRAALSWNVRSTLGAPLRQSGDELWLQCSPGVLHARLA